MKKVNLILCLGIAMLLNTLTIQARTWRVNKMSNFSLTNQLYGDNFGGSINNPVFKDINDAVAWNAVSNDDDTLHIEGSPVAYGDATISKRLVIIGPGYFLADNPKTCNLGLSATIYKMTFNPGSEGSVVMGMNLPYGGSASFPGEILLKADNITVKRCRIQYIYIFTGLTTVNIQQNYFDANSANSCVQTVVAVTYTGPSTFIFNNNICKMRLIYSYGAALLLISECRNNVFNIPSGTGDVLKFQTNDFSNNIISYPVGATIAITSSGQVSHNTANQPLPLLFSDSTNTLAVMSNVFNTTSSSTDGYYQVQENSAAYQSGDDGTDRGAFGGALVSSRYTLSGLAPIPVVYRATSTGVVDAQGELPATIKARTVK